MRLDIQPGFHLLGLMHKKMGNALGKRLRLQTNAVTNPLDNQVCLPLATSILSLMVVPRHLHKADLKPGIYYGMEFPFPAMVGTAISNKQPVMSDEEVLIYLITLE